MRGKNDLQVGDDVRGASNAVIPEEFLEHFDGSSIGSNDLTQLTLGVDQDSSLVAESFDERDPAVLELLKRGDQRVPRPRQVRRHLRPGAF